MAAVVFLRLKRAISSFCNIDLANVGYDAMTCIKQGKLIIVKTFKCNLILEDGYNCGVFVVANLLAYLKRTCTTNKDMRGYRRQLLLWCNEVHQRQRVTRDFPEPSGISFRGLHENNTMNRLRKSANADSHSSWSRRDQQRLCRVAEKYANFKNDHG